MQTEEKYLLQYTERHFLSSQGKELKKLHWNLSLNEKAWPNSNISKNTENEKQQMTTS